MQRVIDSMVLLLGKGRDNDIVIQFGGVVLLLAGTVQECEFAAF